MLLTRRLFFIGLGLTALVAVGSYAWQLPGLAGPQGIVPAEGPRPLFCAIACLAALALIADLAPGVAALVLCFAWRAVVISGAPFLAFQWDVLLIETAFLAALYAPFTLRPNLRAQREPSRPIRLLMAALACKVTLESGVVKLLGGDPAWRDLTALTWHWWTQPLPTWSSVFFAALPLFVQKALCFVMFVCELAAPVLIFGPRRVRLTGALALMALQLGLFVAGNYAFYNLLTFVLAIPLLDDAFLRRLVPRLPVLQGRPPRFVAAGWVAFTAYVVISVSAFFGLPFVAPIRETELINGYGAFAHMTKERPEIIIEASVDGEHWEPYGFRWKPGDVTRRPDFIAPWQPRLDWQMWFAALGDCRGNPWFVMLLHRLLEESPPVLALFETVPLQHPKFLRTRVFQYRFAPRSQPGVWWTREEEGAYCPTVTLGPDGSLEAVR